MGPTTQEDDTAEKDAYIKELVFTNFVISGTLAIRKRPNNRKLNLREIASKTPYLQWRSDYFESLRLTMCDPLTSLSLFTDFRFSIMGAQSELHAYLAALKYVNVINHELGIPCDLQNASIRNVVASVKVFPIDLALMRSMWPDKVSPKVTFPGLYFYYKQVMDTNVVVAIFETGSINFIGGGSREEVVEVLKHLYDNYLVHVRFGQPKQPHKSSKYKNTEPELENELGDIMNNISVGIKK